MNRRILKQIIKESIKELLKEEIKEFNGKKYKKQPNGKWVEVSEHGMTKKEHESSLKRSQDIEREYDKQGSKSPLHHKQEINTHLSAASKLSDKEHDEEELTESINEEPQINVNDLSKEELETKIKDLYNKGGVGYGNAAKMFKWPAGYNGVKYIESLYKKFAKENINEEELVGGRVKSGIALGELSQKAQTLLALMKKATILPIKDTNYDSQPEHTKELIDLGYLEIDKKHRNLVYIGGKYVESLYKKFAKETIKEATNTTLSDKAQTLLTAMKHVITFPIQNTNYNSQSDHVKELIDLGYLEIDKKHRNLVYIGGSSINEEQKESSSFTIGDNVQLNDDILLTSLSNLKGKTLKIVDTTKTGLISAPIFYVCTIDDNPEKYELNPEYIHKVKEVQAENTSIKILSPIKLKSNGALSYNALNLGEKIQIIKEDNNSIIINRLKDDFQLTIKKRSPEYKTLLKSINPILKESTLSYKDKVLAFIDHPWQEDLEIEFVDIISQHKDKIINGSDSKVQNYLSRLNDTLLTGGMISRVSEKFMEDLDNLINAGSLKENKNIIKEQDTYLADEIYNNDYTTVNVSLSYVSLATNIWNDGQHKKYGKQSHTDVFEFKTPEYAANFVISLVNGGVPEEEVELS